MDQARVSTEKRREKVIFIISVIRLPCNLNMNFSPINENITNTLDTLGKK